MSTIFWSIFPLPFSKFWNKINSDNSQNFFLYNIIRYAFELFTLVLFLTLDIVSTQNNLKRIKSIKSIFTDKDLPQEKCFILFPNCYKLGNFSKLAFFQCTFKKKNDC